MKLRAVTHWLFLTITCVLSTTCFAQEKRHGNLPTERTHALDVAQSQMATCRDSRRRGDLKRAEQQCRAAIQTLLQAGFAPQGEQFTLGTILYDLGSKAEAYQLMRKSFGHPTGKVDWDCILGLAAIEQKEPSVAKAIVDFYRRDDFGTGAIAVSTHVDWPKGDDDKTLKAMLLFLRASWIYTQTRENDKAIGLLTEANKLRPNNAAILYLHARCLVELKKYKESVPFFKFVMENATGKFGSYAKRRYQIYSSLD